MAEQLENEDLTADEKKIIEEMLSEDEADLSPYGQSRRYFLKMMSLASAGMLAFELTGAHPFLSPAEAGSVPPGTLENLVSIAFKVNGSKKSLDVDSRMTLLDALRERLELTGSKKGCDHGQCGACTVIVDGRRILSCLTLAATCNGKSVTTIEGLAKGKELHPMQASFVKHDGFQCGYCTPGQICSAVALVEEAAKGELSYVSADVRTKAIALQLSDDEIRERMSGNICRCGAYTNILAAIREVHTGKDSGQLWQFTDEKQSFLTVSNTQIKKGGQHETL